MIDNIFHMFLFLFFMMPIRAIRFIKTPLSGKKEEIMKLFLSIIKEDLILFISAIVMFAMTIVLGARLALYIVVWGNSMMYIACLGTAMFVISAFVLRGFIDSFKETYELKKELERVRR